MKSSPKKFKRQRLEKYYTPHSLTRALLAVEYFQHVWDPAAGAEHILDACALAGVKAFGSDIAPDRHDIAKGDFLAGKDRPPVEPDILTNPPFGYRTGLLALAFIEEALHRTEFHRGKVCMLLHADYDSAKTRRHVFEHRAFARRYVLTERVQWANLEHVERSSTNHCWFVWDWSRLEQKQALAAPTVHYLHNPDGGPFR